MPLFDLQVNGYAGISFNRNNLTAEQLHKACEMIERDGTDAILATIITEDLAVMAQRLANLVKLREGDDLAKRIITGIHIEGPFISAVDGYRGAHPRDAVRPATPDDAQRLIDAGGGLTRIVTLAPEGDANCAATKALVKQGVVVSAGHTNASLDELKAAIDAGLSMFTHLGNGCPAQMPRHDNIIQRALSLSDRVWPCFIADGAHVPFVALRNYLKAVPADRAIVVSDDIAPAGLGPGTFTEGRWTMVIGEDCVARAPDGSHLLGSTLSLAGAAKNLREHLGLDEATIATLTSENPRRALDG